MALSAQERTERARKAGRASQARFTPDERAARARKAHLGQAVAAVVDRAPELTETQKARLTAIFAPSGEAV